MTTIDFTTVRLSRNEGRYNMLSHERQACITLYLPNNNPLERRVVQYTCEIGSENDLDHPDNYCVADFVRHYKAQASRYIIRTGADEDDAAVEWVEEHLIQCEWGLLQSRLGALSRRIEMLQRERRQLVSECDDLHEEYPEVLGPRAGWGPLAPLGEGDDQHTYPLALSPDTVNGVGVAGNDTDGWQLVSIGDGTPIEDEPYGDLDAAIDAATTRNTFATLREESA